MYKCRLYILCWSSIRLAGLGLGGNGLPLNSSIFHHIAHVIHKVIKWVELCRRVEIYYFVEFGF